MKTKIFLLSLSIPIMLALCACNGMTSSPTLMTTNTLSQTPRPTTTPSPTIVSEFERCRQWDMLSDDGNWALCNPMVDPITIAGKNGKVWEFSYSNFFKTDVSYPCTSLLHSTQDGKYLFFALDNDCPIFEPAFAITISVFRMDLSNGNVTQTLNTAFDFKNRTGNLYSVSISPTGRRMAYISEQIPPLSLAILDLQTGEERLFQLDDKFDQAGRFLWSADGTKIAFFLSTNTDLISIKYIDLLLQDSMTTIVNDQPYNWIISEITNEGVILLDPASGTYFYDIITGIMKKITAPLQ